MQIDMHYYGIYVLARAAGIEAKTANVIATASQFVDDNIGEATLQFDSNLGGQFEDGVGRLDTVATAHHVFATANFSAEDQRQVWVPFHFLPGNIGESYTERLKCRMDSQIAREMVAHHISLASRTFSPSLMGIAAHVYADTFSHYGFSGVSSGGNFVDGKSFKFHDEIDGHKNSLDPDVRLHILGKLEKHKKKDSNWLGLELPNIRGVIEGALVEKINALGHGTVSTFPDRPYLVWLFRYKREDAVSGIDCYRNNPATFLSGARAIHGMFDQFRLVRPDLDSGDHQNFDQIRDIVKGVIEFQGNKETRIEQWQEAAEILKIGEIPVYPDENSDDNWNTQWIRMCGDKDTLMTVVVKSPIWHFYQAASIHRTYVLRDLLPRHGLLID